MAFIFPVLPIARVARNFRANAEIPRLYEQPPYGHKNPGGKESKDPRGLRNPGVYVTPLDICIYMCDKEDERWTIKRRMTRGGERRGRGLIVINEQSVSLQAYYPAVLIKLD